MKLKGIELKGTYKVDFHDTWFDIYDDKGYRIYFENSGGYWAKSEFDENGNVLYYVNSDGGWYKSEYDERGNEVHCEDNYGYWSKSEYDERDNLIYFEDSDGEFLDKRIKELTIKEIERLLGYKIKIKGENK